MMRSTESTRTSRAGAAAWLACGGLALACCGAERSPTDAATPTKQGARRASPALTVELADAPLDDVARLLAQASGRPTVVDATAQPYARCVRISVYSPRPLRGGDIVPLITRALAPAGLELETAGEGQVLRRRADAPEPPGCAGISARRRPETSRPTEPAEPPTPEERAREQALEEGIRAVSDTEFELTSAARDALFANATPSTARLIPSFRDGRAVGIRVYAIRSSSPLARLGIRNGDTVLRVDGREITSPEHALQLYAELRGRDRTTVELERRGQPLTLRYRVVH